MTDEELLIWLRVEDTNLTDFAADRIEELLAERDEAKAMQSCGCSYDTPNDVCLGHHRLFERLYAVQRGRLEAERKKAVDAFVDLAIATLAEIKGESHD